MWWRSLRAPVAIDAAQTGVTDGKAAQASVEVPRSMTAAIAGARPVATARSSIAGLSPSTTARTSFRATPALPEDAQAGVLLALAAAAADEEPGEEPAGDERQRRQDDARQGDDRGHALGVDRQPGARLRVEPAGRARQEVARRRVGEHRTGGAGDEARPPRVEPVVDRAGPQQRAEADRQPGERRLGRRRLQARAPEEGEDEGDGHRDEPPRALEEGERRAVEVDARVGGGQRPGDQHGEERTDADGEAEPERLEVVEDGVHLG